MGANRGLFAFPSTLKVRWLLRCIAWWALAVTGGGFAAGLIAFALDSRFAPFLLTPLALGAAFGMWLAFSSLKAAVNPSHTLAAMACVFGACVAAFTQHQQHANADRESLARVVAANPQAAALAESQSSADLYSFLARAAERGRPLPGGWVAKGPWAWLTWALDIVLFALAAPWGLRRYGQWLRELLREQSVSMRMVEVQK